MKNFVREARGPISFLFVLTFPTAFSGIPARAESSHGPIRCAVQAAHADGATVEIQPAPPESSLVPMSATAPGGSARGSLRLAFAAKPSGARGYAIELELELEPDRSTWVDGAPRLWLRARARDLSTRQLLAQQEDHSDRILRDAMVGSLRRQGPRVVFQMFQPRLLARVDALDDPEVAAARARGTEDGLRAAVHQGLVPADEAFRFDIACVTGAE
jgi:hypothetical protein